MERIIHPLTQGSPEWVKFRYDHDGASEAAAMLGWSPHTSRTELLRMKQTGLGKEFSEWVQNNILDYGHEVEAMARHLVEAGIGEALYPTTCSMGRLSASCDGLIIGGELAFEHKQWSAELAVAVSRNELPKEHQPQCQQVLLVTGAEKLLFVVSDGTPENWVSMYVLPDAALQKMIIAGWEQFNEDLKVHQHIEPPAVVVGRAPETLPALRIEVTGMVTASNLDAFKSHAMAVFAEIKTDLKTDEDFANAEKTTKWCGDVESRLDAAKQHALSQTASIDDLFRAIDEIKAEARGKRLELERLVKARKESIRTELVQEGKDALAAHLAALNKRLGRSYMTSITAYFTDAIRGKKTVASLRDAVSVELTRCKLESNAVADKIQANLKTMVELAADFKFLFPDAAQIVLKESDDLTALVKVRIAAHKEAEDSKLATDRQRIREEEERKARKLAESQVVAQAEIKPTPLAVEQPREQIHTFAEGEVGVAPAAVAKKDTRPTDDEIIVALSRHFGVDEHVVVIWIDGIDIGVAYDRRSVKKLKTI